MGSNDDIEKIEEQIEQLLNEEEKEQEEVPKHTTKKLKSIEDIEIKEDKEPTKRIDIVEEEPQEEIEKEETSLKDELTTDEFKPNKNKKKIIIISIVVSIILLIFLIILIISIKQSKKEEKENSSSLSPTQEEIIYNYGNKLKEKAKEYYNKNNKVPTFDEINKLVKYDYKIECEEKYIYDDLSIYLNKCIIDNVKTKKSYGTKQDLQEEEQEDKYNVIVYINKNTKKSTLEKPNNIDNYDIYKLFIEEPYYEVTLLTENDPEYIFYYDDKETVHMINIKTNKKALDPLNYNAILPIFYENNFNKEIVAVNINGKWAIYNLKNRERLTNHKYISLNLNQIVNGPELYINSLDDKTLLADDGTHIGTINYYSGKEIIPFKFKTMKIINNYLLLTDDSNTKHIYDYEGKEYLKNKYEKIYTMISSKYILVNDETSIKLVNITGKTVYDFDVKYNNFIEEIINDNEMVFKFKDEQDKCFQLKYNLNTKMGIVTEIEC